MADAILGNEMFTHYDKAHIGRLCEQVTSVQLCAMRVASHLLPCNNADLHTPPSLSPPHSPRTLTHT